MTTPSLPQPDVVKALRAAMRECEVPFAYSGALMDSFERALSALAADRAATAPDLSQWSVARFGVFEADGSFRELPDSGWESDPLAHTSRWVGGRLDAQLLRAALTAPDRAAAPEHPDREQHADDAPFPTAPREPKPGLLAAAKAVAMSNGFDAALPAKMEALRAAVRAESKPEPAKCTACSIPFEAFSKTATCAMSVCPNPRPGLRAAVLAATGAGALAVEN